MGAQTVTVPCDVLLVTIGIIGLVLARREWRTMLGQREGRAPAKVIPA